jgi:ribose transport system ATP-binding protein
VNAPLTSKPLLRVAGLEKSFFATRAAYDVNFEVQSGEIISLLGENGAGKSTVIKMLAGVYKPESGTVTLNGQPLKFGDSRDGKISFVHQNLGLIDWMTVAENIALVIGYPRVGRLISGKKLRAQADSVLELVGGGLDPDARVFSLSRTDRSLLAIARSLATNPQVLVLDEPTASLPAHDVDRLFTVLRELKQTGVGMIYVSHRLDEVFELCERAVVMRNGTIVHDGPVQAMSHKDLVRYIVGDETVDVIFDQPEAGLRLEVADLAVESAGPVSFDVRRGEIVSLCGLRGAGQEQIGRAIAGAGRVISGSVRLDGESMSVRSPATAITAGAGFSTSNRETEAVAPGLSARENLFLNPRLWGRRAWQFSTSQSERREARRHFRAFGVRPDNPELSLDTFSGGNQQKVILSRWLGLGRKLLVLEEPTMGVDIGAKADIYGLLRNATRTGTSVLVISTDMEEVSKVSHRAIIFARGQIVSELAGRDLNISNLIAAASELNVQTNSVGATK